jgi:hypothetical protein
MMVDLGMRVRRSKTNAEIATTSLDTFGTDLLPVGALAVRATRAVYDAQETTPEDAEAAWRDVDAIEDALRRHTPRRKWWRAKLSLRSMRSGLSRSVP